MILTRRFGGLRMHDVVTPPAEESKVRTLGQTEADAQNAEATAVERDDDTQRTAA